MVRTAQRGPLPVQRVSLGVIPCTEVPYHVRCAVLARTPLLRLTHVRNVPLVPTRCPRQRHLVALAYHAKKDPTLPEQGQHRARGAQQEPTFRIQGVPGVCRAKLALIIQSQELPVLAVSAKQEHTRQKPQLLVQPVMLGVGHPQAPRVVSIAKLALTTLLRDP